VSSASRAAQSGPVSFVTVDQYGNLASDGGALGSSLNQMSATLNQHSRRLDENAQGVAMALAMGGIFLPDSKSFALSAGYGTFDGMNAFSAEMALRVDRDAVLTGGLGVGLEGGEAPTKLGGRVAVQFAW
jgi:hypothetical protein